jgi:hypothetical protein
MSGAEKCGGQAACAALLFALAAIRFSVPRSVMAEGLFQSVASQSNSNPAPHTVTKSKQKISASAVKGIPPAAPPESPEDFLAAEQIARRVPEKAMEAILASIRASSLPTANDLQGGFHEESGVGGETASGAWIDSFGKPGPYFNPAVDRVATMEEIPADQNLRDEIAHPEVFWHIHPAGVVRVGTLTYFWEQAPSDLDRVSAAPGAINIVVGALDHTVYFYNRRGPVLTLSLEDFLRGPA